MREDLQALLARARADASPTAAGARLVSLDELSAGPGGFGLSTATEGEEGEEGEAAEPSEAERLAFTALRGRFIELSGSGATAALSAAVQLVWEAQVAGEPVAWIAQRGSSFYPPDVVEGGVDLTALAVIRVPDVTSAGRAAERLLRSNAFGLVILDLAGPDCVIERNVVHRTRDKALSIANQGRLVTLAQQADSLVVCITSKKRGWESMGSLISLRADASRERDEKGFCVSLQVLKDKRRGPGWGRRERAKGPAGLT